METEKSSTYLSLLLDLFPLFFIAFSIFFLKGIRGLRASIIGKSFVARFINVIISSALGSALSVGCALLLPLIDKNPDPSTMIGIVVFVSVAGVKIIDSVLYQKLGVHFVDASESDSADAQWVRMTQDERAACLQHWSAVCEEKTHGD